MSEQALLALMFFGILIGHIFLIYYLLIGGEGAA